MRDSIHRLISGVAALVVAVASTACSDLTPTSTGNSTATPAVVSANVSQASVAGAAFSYDATKGNATFSDPVGKGLTYAISFSPSANGLSASNGVISGTPVAPSTVLVKVMATDGAGTTVTDSFHIVAFAAGLKTPTLLPATPYHYADASVSLPGYFTDPASAGGNVAGTDNTPVDNAITDAGATLGRVLFYDPRLSGNDHESCSSCHNQANGFGDTALLSRGFNGGSTHRHAMSLANSRYYQRGKFFWDERAATLEVQVVTPIQDTVEMGMTLDNLEIKLGLTSYYPALFQAAFGTPAVTRDRISKALAQYVRSMTSYKSKYDLALATTPANFSGVFTAQEITGGQLFGAIAPSGGVASVGCTRCHTTTAVVSNNIHNNGLDLVTVDAGAGNGQFKAPSLRNVGVHGRYMHDGRFTSLTQVVQFYNTGVQANPNLDQILKAPGGAVRQLGLNANDISALVAFMNTLTDQAFLTDIRFSSPFGS